MSPPSQNRLCEQIQASSDISYIKKHFDPFDEEKFAMKPVFLQKALMKIRQTHLQ